MEIEIDKDETAQMVVKNRVERKKVEVIGAIQMKIDQVKIDQETVDFPLAMDDMAGAKGVYVMGTIPLSVGEFMRPGETPDLANKLARLDAAEYLRQAKALIENPDHWTQGELEEIHYKNIFDRDGWLARCAVGALDAARKHMTNFEMRMGVLAIWALDRGMGMVDNRWGPKTEMSCHLAHFNDTHSHEDLMLAMKYAIHELETP